MTHQILVFNGPNLNLLGTREPEVYGSDTLTDIFGDLHDYAATRDATLRDVQSNHEGALVDALHDARVWAGGVVFNADAFTHTGIAMRDAISAVGLPVVEPHVSSTSAREPFRHRSLATVCLGVVAGFGRDGYAVALDALIRHLERGAR
jgi:3-dehydroquinate dehydratase II